MPDPKSTTLGTTMLGTTSVQFWEIVALTFIVFIVIMFVTESLSSALMIISLLSQFLIVSTLLRDVASGSDPRVVAQPWYPTSALRAKFTPGPPPGPPLGPPLGPHLYPDPSFPEAAGEGADAGEGAYASLSYDEWLRPPGAAPNTFDADRRVAEHVRWRSDPYRVAAGSHQRRDLVQKYVEEEVQETENRPWWGRWDV